ncbi:hypothetical protein L226DRAFT_153222 [Lentinus tigrinus ALCF2SS1-7]|uniref:uncharacterized protein n=1 Tax=Lentinus tigrinus ALCF2SS1-7 TaxID=1328758 RepID=UPI001165DADE|nr:hypothetical protein L226DRAFT_153222 [Lentinus tigrinus ALCF2SS1-7]
MLCFAATSHHRRWKIIGDVSNERPRGTLIIIDERHCTASVDCRVIHRVRLGRARITNLRRPVSRGGVVLSSTSRAQGCTSASLIILIGRAAQLVRPCGQHMNSLGPLCVVLLSKGVHFVRLGSLCGYTGLSHGWCFTPTSAIGVLDDGVSVGSGAVARFDCPRPAAVRRYIRAS